MKLPPFELHRPSSIAEASALLRELGDAGAAYHGGSELLLTMKLGLAHYPHLVALRGIEELAAVRLEGETLVVGAGATHASLEQSPLLRRAVPAMASMLADVANCRVRTVGTIGGNLCFADPHSDPATFLAAVGAVLVCGDGRTTRRLSVGDFQLGPYETALAPGELLVAVEVPLTRPGGAVSHLRMRLHERPAVTVATAVQLAGDSLVSAQVAVGSVSGVPVLGGGLEQLLAAAAASSCPVEHAAVRACAKQMAGSVTPLEDGEGSADYKAALVEVLVRRSVGAALAAARDAAA